MQIHILGRSRFRLEKVMHTRGMDLHIWHEVNLHFYPALRMRAGLAPVSFVISWVPRVTCQ